MPRLRKTKSETDKNNLQSYENKAKKVDIDIIFSYASA